VYLLHLDLSTGAITNPCTDASLGNLLSGTGLPVNKTSGCLIVAEPSTPLTLRQYGVNEAHELAYATWDPSDPEGTSTYHVATLDLGTGAVTTASLGAAGDVTDPTDPASGRGYFYGLSMCSEGVAVLGREASGVTTIERWTGSGASWSLDAVLATGDVTTDEVLRPSCVPGTDDVLYFRGEYVEFDVDFTTALYLLEAQP